MGADYIQYTFADEIVVTKEMQKYMNEKLIYMPVSYYEVHHKYIMSDILKSFDTIPDRVKELNVTSDTFVFACFNQYYKMDRIVWNLWMNILTRVPNSVLVLF
jgi:predicted O-linked N-acetylglucosamine transferase (SPINDLY family)